MSDEVFPVLRGLTWNCIKQPEFSTLIQTGSTGIEKRAQLWHYPRWSFELKYEFIENNPFVTGLIKGDLASIMSFFLKRKGRFESFYYADPDDTKLVDQLIGIGDGTNKVFQAIRTINGFTEPVFKFNGTPIMTVGGEPYPWFTVDNKGLITLSEAPALGKEVVLSGYFYFRVRFKQDMQEYSKFYSNLWLLKKCEFISLKVNE
jgi:uncharacterized protein (TIGR02217 family)